MRALYSPFEAGLQAPTGRVYRHQIPGGQLSNLRQQAEAVGVGGRFEEIELAYERANALLGDIVKVTPTSKVVGDLALYAVSAGIDLDELERSPERFDLPDSVLDFLRGGLGQPAAGLPQPFTDRALAGRPPAGAARTARGRGPRGARGRRARPPGRARPDHVPGPLRRLPRGARSRTATCRCCRRPRSSTACARTRRSRSTSRPAFG